MSLITNLIAYYKMQDTSDSTGNGNTLTNNNSVTFDAGLVGNAADLGSANTNKSLTIASNLGIIGGAVSMQVWVKLNTEIASGFMYFSFIDANSQGVANYLYYDFNSGTRRVVAMRKTAGVANPQVNSTITLGIAAWHQLVYTFDGSTVALYVDGVSAGTIAASGTGTGGLLPDAFKMGCDDSGTPGSFANTKIDEVGIWTRALTSTEVAQLYNAGNYNQYPFTYSFNDTITESEAFSATIKIPTLSDSISSADSLKEQTNKFATSGQKSSTSWTNTPKSL